jgi:hypothetical protein
LVRVNGWVCRVNSYNSASQGQRGTPSVFDFKVTWPSMLMKLSFAMVLGYFTTSDGNMVAAGVEYTRNYSERAHPLTFIVSIFIKKLVT